jgi:type I restriction enzyme, S subunit
MNYLFTYGPVPVDEAERVPLKETEIGFVPDHWEVVKLGDVCERFPYGTSERCTIDGPGAPVLRIPNVIGGDIDTHDLKYAELPEKTADKLKLSVSDVLFVRTNGRREYTGRCAVFQGEPEGALFASYLIRAQLEKDIVLPAFLQSYTETTAGRQWLSGRASEAADGKYNLNTQILKDVSLPLPSLVEQDQVTSSLEAIDAKIAVETNRKRTLEVLFKTLLHNLMTGKVRVPDVDLAEIEEVV